MGTLRSRGQPLDGKGRRRNQATQEQNGLDSRTTGKRKLALPAASGRAPQECLVWGMGSGCEGGGAGGLDSCQREVPEVWTTGLKEEAGCLDPTSGSERLEA